MTKTVRITSPDNPHAIAAYALPVVMGVGNLWKGQPPKAMVELIGTGPAVLVMLAMITAGVLGMAGAWTASRVADPIMSLTIEAGAVGAVGAALAFYVVTLFAAYDPSAVITTISMALVVAAGSVWRLVQVLRDARRVRRAVKLGTKK